MSLIVAKVGGAVASETAGAIRNLVTECYKVVVVHGAGPQISQEMERQGLVVEFVEGRRVTTRAALGVVRASLGEVNAALCKAIGPKAVSLFGDEIGLQATPIPGLGLVGQAVPSAPPAVANALESGLIPVVAPLADGPLNVNADEAAAALAVGLGAERLVFFTDVPGLLLEGAVVPSIGVDEAERVLPGLEGGIVPKLHAAVTAARLGVRAEIGETAVLA
jgi:acetylglutamate kinase